MRQEAGALSRTGSQEGTDRIHVRWFADRAALEAALVARLAQAFEHPVSGAGEAVMLSGGSTPIPAYRALAQHGVRRIADRYVLFSDERHVPSDSEASNFHQSRPLLAALALPEAQVLRVRTELPLEEAAADYERRLEAMLDAGIRIGLGLLGLGADGHTASLFSAADLERGAGRLAIAVQRPDGRGAVSVTPRLLAQVATPLFVVAGNDKRDALERFLAGDPGSVARRAVAACPSVEVWVDREAYPRARQPQPDETSGPG